MTQILKAVNYMHCKGYVHRDVKPENLLIDGSDNSLKLIDFGLSIKLPPGCKLRDRQGTPYYMAPEVLNKSYDNKCDIWSCGVILYILLSGRPPFNADHELEIMRLIKIGKYSMTGRVWEFVSSQAKELIKGMLCYNPKKRLTAKQALDHDWFIVTDSQDDPFSNHGQQKTSGNQKKEKENHYQLTKQEIQNALANMKTFKVTQKLKQATYAYIVTHLLTKAEKKPLARLFSEINQNHNGHLSEDEMKQAYDKYFGNSIDKEEISKMFKTIDVSGSGEIEYTEFMLACIPEKVLLTDENMAVVFKIFDEDGSGSICKDEIKEVFSTHSKKISDKVAKEILA